MSCQKVEDEFVFVMCARPIMPVHERLCFVKKLRMNFIL